MAEDKKSKKETKEAEMVAEVTPVKAAEVKTTKAGKRSAKSQKEVAEKQAKEDRKAQGEEVEKKPVAKPVKSRADRAGKRYKAAAKLIDRNKVYEPAEAIELAAKTGAVKFDPSLELHVRLGVDPKQSDQNVRGTVTLPGGSGKTVRVATLDEADSEKILPKLEKEQIDFDVLVTTPAMMPKLAKFAKLLGPRGLMPSPKSGTVTGDLKKAADEAKAGKVEFRVDQAGIVHLSIGKLSLGAEKLQANFDTAASAIKSAKPASVKGIYIQSAYLATTMSPSIKITI